MNIDRLIQSGILVTLLSCAFGLGRIINSFENKIEDHEKRIVRIEDRIK